MSCKFKRFINIDYDVSLDTKSVNMAVEVMDDFELEKLRAEIQQEKQMK